MTNSTRGSPTSRSSAPRSTSRRRTGPEPGSGRGRSAPRHTSRAPITWISGWRSSTGSRSWTSATRTARTVDRGVPRQYQGTGRRGGVARHRSRRARRRPFDHLAVGDGGRRRARLRQRRHRALRRSRRHRRQIEGNLASHGTPMRRLIESGAVPGTHFVQVGLRGYWPPQDTSSGCWNRA